jgi:two-component sensor histidine kinase
MDIYSQKNRWKFWLAMFGLLIVGTSLVYTNYVVQKVAVQERARAEQWAEAIAVLSLPFEADSLFVEESTTLIFKLIESNKNIPAIVTDEGGRIINYANYDTAKINLDKELAEMRASGNDSIEISTRYYQNFVHFKESILLKLLRFFPYFQLILISLFVGIGYFLFNWARRSEQNQVWIGLAKETAHQLGTPISAMMGWIDHLKLIGEDNEELMDIADELSKDVDRLNKIADRFSKIGAIPELTQQNVLEIIEHNMIYMKRRAPRKVIFQYPPTSPPIFANINAPLFDWVLENLTRNALDAMSKEGKICVEVIEDQDDVMIDITDTGKGIPQKIFLTIFKPGFSTKKRGWGLGLSLSERIIKNYHNGRIFVKESKLGEGTTFRIQLPKIK